MPTSYLNQPAKLYNLLFLELFKCKNSGTAIMRHNSEISEKIPAQFGWRRRVGGIPKPDFPYIIKHGSLWIRFAKDGKKRIIVFTFCQYKINLQIWWNSTKEICDNLWVRRCCAARMPTPTDKLHFHKYATVRTGNEQPL